MIQLSCLGVLLLVSACCAAGPTSWTHVSPAFTDVGFLDVAFGNRFLIACNQDDSIGDMLVPDFPMYWTSDFKQFSSTHLSVFEDDGTPNAVLASDSMYMVFFPGKHIERKACV